MNHILFINFSKQNSRNALLIFILVINLIITSISFPYDELQLGIKMNSANITLKIKGKETQNIFNDGYNIYPNVVKINGIKQDRVQSRYYFNKTDNKVELYWDNNNINCIKMFCACRNIYEINFDNFDTSKATSMNLMFSSCTNLTSLDLSKFDTSNVEEMPNMFNNCRLLTSLNLSNFNISKVTNMDNMFDACDNLIYINIKNFHDLKLKESQCIFDRVQNNIIVCHDNESLIKSQLELAVRKCYTIDCSDDWLKKQKKMNAGNGSCLDSCEKDENFIYEYNGNCFTKCSKGNFTQDNITHCKCEEDKCLICTKVALELNLCNKCNEKDNYYPKENDESNYGEYIECYKEIDGYYLDKDNSIFKKCFNTCETCEIEGNSEIHNCLICNTNYPYAINTSDYYNCYIECKFYYYFKNKNYKCTKDEICPNEYPILINGKECIKNNIRNIQYNIIIIEKNETLFQKVEDEINYYDLILNITETIFTSDNYDTSKIDKGENEIINIDKINIAFRTSESSKNDSNRNISKINLGECESLLRSYYNISKNEFLYLKQVEVEQEGMKIKKVEYDVYCKLYQSNSTKLNLSICKNVKIFLSLPIIISENIDKFNINSGYYNDICYTATSDSGTDITFTDRKEEYKKGDKIICQDDCDFSHYDYDAQEAICSCNVKEFSSSFSNMKINKEKIFEKFIDIKNMINIKIMICHKVLLSKSGLIHNIPFYSLIIVIMGLVSILSIDTVVKYMVENVSGFESINVDELERNVTSFKPTLFLILGITVVILAIVLVYINAQTAFLKSCTRSCREPSLFTKGAKTYGNLSIVMALLQLVLIVMVYFTLKDAETVANTGLNMNLDLNSIMMPFLVYYLLTAVTTFLKGTFAKGWEPFAKENEDYVYAAASSASHTPEANPIATYKSTTRRSNEAIKQSQPYLYGEEPNNDPNKKSSYIPEELQNDYPPQYDQQPMGNDPFMGDPFAQPMQPMGSDPYAPDPFAQSPMGNPYGQPPMDPNSQNPYNNGFM